MFRVFMIIFLSFSLTACASMKTTIRQADLLQGKRYFEAGYYKRAMHLLMPLAMDGVPQAQYGVGYMYYYGYGAPQDSDMGYLWIKRAADQEYPPAVIAVDMIITNLGKEERAERRFQIKSEKLKEKGLGPEI